MRGAPKKQAEDVKRNRGIKFSDREWNEIKRKADELDISCAKYIRAALFGS